MLRGILHGYLAQMRSVWEPCWEGWMLGSQHSLLRDVCGGLGLLTLAFTSLSVFSFLFHRQDSPKKTLHDLHFARSLKLLCPDAVVSRCHAYSEENVGVGFHVGTPSSKPPSASDSHMACLFIHPHSSHPRGHGDQDRRMSVTPRSVHMHMCTYAPFERPCNHFMGVSKSKKKTCHF